MRWVKISGLYGENSLIGGEAKGAFQGVEPAGRGLFVCPGGP